MAGSVPKSPVEGATRAPVFTEAQQRLIDHAAAAPAEAAVSVLLSLAADFWRADQPDEFAECFRRAYLLEPVEGIKLARLLGAETSPRQWRDLARTLVDRGVCYAPVLGLLAQAEAALGETGAVRRLMDYDRLFHQGTCGAPPGLTEAEFHRALADEIRAKLKFYEAPRLAIRRGWRHNDVLSARTPALQALSRLLKREIDRYIASLPDDPTHPFIASRPSEIDIGSWAVVSGRETHHLAHVHPRAWATGVYYVVQPEVSQRHDAQLGWLRVGPPGDRLATGSDAASPDGWETRMIAPTPGSFVLMPAYFYHETEPMGVDQERICIAFEAQFPELSRSEDLDLH
jgi:Putative 2OG-Fe(II) oxygenase